VTLRRSGPIRYQVSYLFDRNERADHVSWSYSHGALSFRHGFFGKGGAGINVVGRYVPAGVKMAHAQLTAAKYTLVLRSKGTPVNDEAPPKTQFTDFRKASWWYCTTGKPVFKAVGGPPTPPTPTPPTPTPPPVMPSGEHPPYGTYLCTDKSGDATGAFTLSDPFSYSDASSGTFTMNTAGRIDFHGGRFDDSDAGWQLYGLFTAPSSIVLISKVPTANYGPDADTSGTHTYWYCGLS
jgi:hypothetical protein